MGVDNCWKDGEVLLCRACCGENLEGRICLMQKDAIKYMRSKKVDTQEDVGNLKHLIMMPVKQSDGHYECVIVDLDCGVKTVPTDRDKRDIFDLAWKGAEADVILEKLKKFDFDVNNETDNNGNCLTHIAVRSGMSQMPLLRLLVCCFGADINLVNRDGLSCLMIAAIMGDGLTVDTLLDGFVADPNLRSPVTGRTALHYASQRNHVDVVRVLINHRADYNIEDQDGALADELALIFRATECQQLINTHRAQRMRHLISMIEKDCLKKQDVCKSELYMTDGDGFTLIMAAAKMNCCKSLDWLVREPGAPINAQHQQSLKTALSFAAEFGHVEAIELLMQNGADPHIHDIRDNLPLHNAAIHHQVASVIELLKYQNAMTGLYKAEHLSRHPCIQKEIQAALQRRMKDIVLPALLDSCASGDANKLYTVMEMGDDINHVISGGSWPIYLAAENGHVEVVKLLHELGGEVERCHPHTGNSILHAACLNGHTEVAAYILDSCSKCAAMKRKTCHSMVNAFNFKKETPLIIAANGGYTDLVDLLLRHGASSSILDPCTEKLFDGGHYEGIRFMIETHRKKHTNTIMSTIAMWKPLKRLKELFLPKFDHNLRTGSGDTPLMLACLLNKLDVVYFLLQSAIYDIINMSGSSVNLTLFDTGSNCNSGAVMDQEDQKANSNSNDTSPPIKNNSCGDKERDETKSQPHAASAIASSHSFCAPPESTQEQDETSVTDTINSLLDSIASTSRGSVYTGYAHVNHLCAVSYLDGRTAYHRAVQEGDNVKIMTALLEVDKVSINIQDNSGLSAIHLACQLNRKRTVALLTSLPEVDLNCRTLDGKLPEEMSTSKQIISLVINARNQKPLRSSSPAAASSMFKTMSSDRYETYESSPNDTDLNTQYELFQCGALMS